MLATLVIAMTTASLAVGTPAPDVSAKNQDGKTVRLSDLRGKKVLIFFYPKDDTPGCTKEACALRDSYGQFERRGVTILGISRQGAESHRAFKAKHRLPFDLLSDEDGSLARAFDVPTIPLLGWHRRQSVLLDEQGRVLRAFPDVDPIVHSKEVLAVIDAAAGANAQPPP